MPLYSKSFLAFDPKAQPLVTSCLTESNCTCVSNSRLSNQNSKPHKPKTAYAKMINQIKADKQKYAEKKEQIVKTDKRKGFRKPTTCGKRGLACFTVDQNSFQTEPRWDGEDDCFCSNASNGTFFCIRGISEKGKFIYGMIFWRYFITRQGIRRWAEIMLSGVLDSFIALQSQEYYIII